MALRRDGRLAVLVGDIRTKGSFYSMQHDLIRVGAMEAVHRKRAIQLRQ